MHIIYYTFTYFSGAPTLNFMLKNSFTKLIEHSWLNNIYHSCTPPPLNISKYPVHTCIQNNKQSGKLWDSIIVECSVTVLSLINNCWYLLTSWSSINIKRGGRNESKWDPTWGCYIVWKKNEINVYTVHIGCNFKRSMHFTHNVNTIVKNWLGL